MCCYPSTSTVEHCQASLTVLLSVGPNFGHETPKRSFDDIEDSRVSMYSGSTSTSYLSMIPSICLRMSWPLRRERAWMKFS